MTVPDYQAFMRPALEVASAGENTAKEVIQKTSTLLGLTEKDLEEMLPSGKQTKASNRAHWAITYLVQAGALERPARGLVKITKRGKNLLKDCPDKVDNNDLLQFKEFVDFRSRSRGENSKDDDADFSIKNPSSENGFEDQTPEEQIEKANREISSALARELLNRVVAVDPTFFEHLIIDLMLSMGYGGAGSGHHLGKTQDGGVDGLINEDPLGLDTVFLQAKRYSPGNNIGGDKIREFAGSLHEQGATKGVFVTTSSFTAQARASAQKSSIKIILIDGEELTKLMIQYEVGVRTFRSVKLRKIDEEYFSEVGA